MKRSTAPVSQRSWVQIPYRPEFFFRPSFHYCERRYHIHVFIRSSNIWLSYFRSRLFTTSRVYLEPPPSWLVSSFGRALHRYRRGHGFKSRRGLNFFFRPSFHYCLSSIHYCGDRYHIHVFIRSSNIWLSYIHSRLVCQVVRKAIEVLIDVLV